MFTYFKNKNTRCQKNSMGLDNPLVGYCETHYKKYSIPEI